VWRSSWRKFLPSLAAALGVGAALAVPAVAATVTAAQYGFSFSLPPRWTQIPLDSKDIGAFISAAAKGDPSMENVLDQQAVQAGKKGLKIFAVGPVSGDFFPNMNIAVASAAGTPTGSAFIDLMTAEVKLTLTEAGAMQLKVVPTHIPLGPAVQATYKLQFNLWSRVFPVYGLQFYLEHGPRLYVITFSALSPAEDRATAQIVDGTWRW